jgi:hypothetical protein
MLALVAVLMLGYFLPRFSAYFLGPAFLVAGAASFIALNKYFFPFQSDGSIAGLIVPGIMWLWLITCCVMGGVLIGTGRSRVKRKSASEAAEQAVAADRPKTGSGWTTTFGVTMKSKMISAALVIGAISVMSGCEQPFDKTPPGFAEACYGGRDGAAKNWVCSDDRLVLSVEGKESDWPNLAKIVADFGRARGLEVFDTSSNVPNYVRTLEVNVCSSRGLFLLMDKRIYSGQSTIDERNKITTHLRTYDKRFDWKPLAEQFVATFRQNWSGAVQLEWPEFIPGNEKKGLPDSVKSCD